MRFLARLAPALFVLGVFAAFAWTLRFLYEKSRVPPVTYQTVSAEKRDIIQKTVATGAIVPRREVAIKPQVSGVLQRLVVEAGQVIKEGDLIGEIRIIPNVVSVNAAESRQASAQISFESAQKEYERMQALYKEQLISTGELNKAQLDLDLARQEVRAAKDNLQLVKSGAIRGSGKVSNQVRSTVAGMVLELPVKLGSTVIESNTFNEGTNIAWVADMSDLIFQGHVDESEVGKLAVGMPVSLKVGAIESQRFEGKLEYIAPKGIDKEGTIEFEIRAGVTLDDKAFVRANYSATAEIVLERRDGVLAIGEKLVAFEGERRFVEVETAPQIFERRELELGLSDGIYVEIVSGVDESDRLKVPDPKRGG